ncbi:MAG TPA: SMC family ATPase [Gemmatimonadales bacterium]|nr:SMC family ATPase [Gemmatimonadales bacterium]
MQIHRLRLVNFRQHELTELDFGAGLTGIVGPNGAGKTTLLEAIAWAMYGATAARGGRDSIKRRGAPPRSRVEVELEFSLGRHRYRVVRSLFNAELYQDGEPAPIANSVNAVTERITRLLGMTRDEFFNTYFTGQKELAVMAAMKSAERAQFLSRVLGYERISKAQERLREKRSALRARHEALRSSLADPAALEAEAERATARLAAATSASASAVSAAESAAARLAEARPHSERLQQLRDRALALETERRIGEHAAEAAAERVERLDHQVAEATAARARLEELWHDLEPLAALRDEAAQLRAGADAFAMRRQIEAQLVELNARSAALDERHARLPAPDAVAGAAARVAEIRAALAASTLEAEEQRTVWVRDAQDAQTKRKGLLDQFHELKQQRERIVAAGREGDCPTCARPLGDEFETVLGVLDRQLDEVVYHGNFYKHRIEQLAQEPPALVEADGRRLALEQELGAAAADSGRLAAERRDAAALVAERDSLAARVRELEAALARLPGGYDRARHDEIQRRMEALEPLALQAERVRGTAERATALAAELAEARVAAGHAAEKVATLRARIAELSYDESAYRAARDAEQTAERERRDTELALVRARAEQAAAAEAAEGVACRRAERAAREAEAKIAAADYALHQELDRALNELRTDLNATLRPDLSELASGFVNDLTRGRYTELELDEDYGGRLLDGGEPRTVISGGEEDVANLALRLAISQMIAERAGQPLSLLVLDEIFGSLDEDRRAAVVELLRSLADRFPQVILITHVESVREGFDRVIRVGYDMAKGVAVVQEDAGGDIDVAA